MSHHDRTVMTMPLFFKDQMAEFRGPPFARFGGAAAIVGWQRKLVERHCEAKRGVGHLPLSQLHSGKAPEPERKKTVIFYKSPPLISSCERFKERFLCRIGSGGPDRLWLEESGENCLKWLDSRVVPIDSTNSISFTWTPKLLQLKHRSSRLAKILRFSYLRWI